MAKKPPDTWQPMLLGLGGKPSRKGDKQPSQPEVVYEPEIRRRPKDEVPARDVKAEPGEAWWRRAKDVQAAPQRPEAAGIWAQAWRRLLYGEGWTVEMPASKRNILEISARSLEVRPGVVEGSVGDVGERPQHVQLRWAPLTQAEWTRLARQLLDDGTDAAALAALESRELPVGLVDAADRHTMSLLPRRLALIVAACTCGGARLPCDHVLAVHLGFAARLHREPTLLLKLRGLTAADLSELVERIRCDAEAASTSIAPTALTDPFAANGDVQPEWALIERPVPVRQPLPLPEGWRARESLDVLVRKVLEAARQRNVSR